jgi:hypothetical protein
MDKYPHSRADACSALLRFGPVLMARDLRRRSIKMPCLTFVNRLELKKEFKITLS